MEGTTQSYEVTCHELEIIEEPELVTRPTHRSQCKGGPRPCPWVSCAEHLLWTIPHLALKTDDEILDILFKMPETCLLDVTDQAEELPQTIRDIGDALGITHQRVDAILNGRRGHLGVLDKAKKRLGAVRQGQN
jgi:hypothetical protein